MNVAIFTDNDFDKVNGVTTTFRAALESAPAGTHLRVYTAASLPVETDAYLALRSVGMPIPFYSEMQIYIPRFREFLKRARADRIDLVHLTTPGPIGLAALYVAWRLDLPLVGSFHTDLAAYAALLSGSSRLGALMREYMRWPYGRCTRVLVPSEHTRQLLVSAKSNPGRIDVWPRGVDTTLFSPAKRSSALRERWHVSDRRPALLYVGRVSREKGLLQLPAISDRLYKLGVEHRCIVVGDGPLLPTLRERLPDAVFTGALSRQAVAEAFASADCFVFPSTTDTAGNVVLEAQASGLPVVVSGSGGPREQMVAGLTGTVCHHEDPDEWATAIAGVLVQPQRARFSQSSRQYAQTRTWERAMQPLYRAYREVHEGVSRAESAETVTAAARGRARAARPRCSRRFRAAAARSSRVRESA
jgi:glycosyltransferase involved in cell wall biosynthesis